MSHLPTLPLLVDAMIADTAHMTVEEVGAHFRLLMFAWRSPGCCLPDDDARLARMLGVTAKRWAALKPSVMSLWVLSSSTYTNERLTREHQFVRAKVEQRRACGKLGGRPKSLENNERTKAKGSENEKQNENKPKAPTPTPKYTPIVPLGDEPEGFVEFREAYPKRNTAFPTTEARKRWLEARKRGADPAAIIAGAKAYAAEQARIGKAGSEFVKTADAWLNRQRWLDYAATPLPGSPETSGPDAYLARLTDERWRTEVSTWRARRGHWPLRSKTPPPDDPATKVPAHILAEFGIRHRSSAVELKLTGTG